MVIDGTFGSEPRALKALINENLPTGSPGNPQLVFVYNTLPAMADLRKIEKLTRITEGKLAVFAVFTEKFSVKTPLNFPHLISNHLKIFYKLNKRLFKGNFFVTLKDGKINFIDSQLDFTELAFHARKLTTPGGKFEDSMLSGKNLKARVIDRLKKGKLELLNMESDKYEAIGPRLSQWSKIYFIHAACSACQLKALMSRLRLRQIMDGPNQAIILSVMADSTALLELMGNRSNNVPVFVDSRDEFTLFSIITSDKDNPVLIDVSEIQNRERS